MKTIIKSTSYGELIRYLIAVLSILLLNFMANAQATYYWVGGTGNWSDYANHWATTSGGTEFHLSMPSELDDVIFDENSFTSSGQQVMLDVEATCRVMDWRAAAFTPGFISDPLVEYTDVTISGSAYFNTAMSMDILSMSVKPSSGPIEFDPNGVSFGDMELYFILNDGGVSLQDSLSAGVFAVVNVFNDFVSNGHPIHLTDEFSIRNTFYATIDLANSPIYTKNFKVTGFRATTGVLRMTGASVEIIYPGGYTQIDKTRHPNPLVENYIVSANHSIMNVTPIFDNLIINKGVELIVHDYIAGVEFNDMVAAGEGTERISIKSFTEGVAAQLIKATGEVNFSHVDFKDISTSGSATFNAYGSANLGNVSGINFFKADQEISFSLENKTFADVGNYFQLNGSSTSGQMITYSSSNEGVAIINGTELLIVGVGSSQITASQAGDDLFNAASPVVRLFEVSKLDQAITFSAIPDTWVAEGFVNLDAVSSHGLPIDYTITGPASLNGSVLEFTGTGTVQVTASQPGDENHFPAQDVIRTFTVFKEQQTVSFADLVDTWIGDGVVNLQATSTAGLPIDFQVSGPATLNGTSLELNGAGTVQVTARQLGSDHYLAAENVVQTFLVYKETQSLTFPAITDVWVANGAVSLNATSSAGLPVVYEVAGPATLNGTIVQLNGVGTVQVTARQLGDAHYLPADEVIRTFSVYKEAQSLTFSAIEDTWIADGFVNLDATSSSGLSVSYEVTGPATLDGSILTLEGVGTVQVRAKQLGDAHYLPAEDVIRTFSVYKESQSMTFSAIEDTWIADGFVNLDATSSVGLSVSYEVTGPATLDGSILTLEGVGMVQVRAKQLGDTHYLPAEDVIRTFSVYKETQSVTFSAIEDTWIADGFVNLNATASSGLAVLYEVSGPATLKGSALTLDGVGTVQVIAMQNGDGHYLAADPVVQTFSVFKQAQDISFNELPDTWVGDLFINLNANATSGLPVTYQVSGQATIEGQVLTITGEGPVQVIAKQSGNENYLPASEVTQTFNAFKKDQEISFSGISNQNLDDETLTLSAVSNSGLPITYEVEGPARLNGNTLTFNGVGVVQVTAHQAGNESYHSADAVTQSFEVFKVLGLKETIEVVAYPNPVMDELFVRGDNIALIELYDANGRLLTTQTANSNPIDFRGYAPGAYLLKVGNDQGFVSKRIVKRR